MTFSLSLQKLYYNLLSRLRGRTNKHNRGAGKYSGTLKELTPGRRSALKLRVACATAFRNAPISTPTQRTQSYWKTEVQDTLALAADKISIKHPLDPVDPIDFNSFVTWLARNHANYTISKEVSIADKIHELSLRLEEVLHTDEMSKYLTSINFTYKNGGPFGFKSIFYCPRFASALIEYLNRKSTAAHTSNLIELSALFSEFLTTLETKFKINFGDAILLFDELGNNSTAQHRGVSDFSKIFDNLAKYSASLYDNNCSELNIIWPIVDFETTHIDESRRDGLLNWTALSGQCRIMNEEAPISIVVLGVRDKAFSWESAKQLPYVLLHEIFCHAYQDITRTERLTAEAQCAWTEGWMDALAVRMLEDWLNTLTTRSLPQWVAEEASEVLAAAKDLHKRRSEPGIILGEESLGQRGECASAPKKLIEAYQGRAKNQYKALKKVYKFSLLFNALPVPAKMRTDVADRLNMLLENAHLTRRDRILAACNDFVRYRDWGRLESTLTELCQTAQ